MPCKICDAPIIVGRGFCKRCYYQRWRAGTLDEHSTKKRPLEERFMGFFNRISPTGTGCLEWPGQRRSGKFAYGVITIEVVGQKHSKLLSAHRISYEIHKGKIPKNRDILHTCDNPPCVNPLHLFIGTRGENNKDCASKGRNARGVKNGHAKLSDDAIREIRASNKSNTSLAKQFGVTQPTICRIRKGTRWKHVNLS